MIYLYNSLHLKKEAFKPIIPGAVGLYTCGPTVYDFQHIGNMRAYVAWDILKRFLVSQQYTVTHIMNITDVGHLTSDADAGEDKMQIARTRERLSSREIADKYFGFFKIALEKLNVVAPNRFVKATDLIDDMIVFVQVLDEKGYLYRTSDGMYFDTSRDAEYGLLGRIDAQGLRAGARVELNPEKRSVTDFAVWKFSPKNAQRDMEWESPWGVGFPGWHLECSVISRKYLGDSFDIHTGGKEHRTVHHPNEMAQSKAVTGKRQANYWMHNNFLTFKDKKMAKSAGTFVRLADLVAGGIAPLSYRYFLLQTHYRKEISYSIDAIKAAHQGLQNLYSEISFLDEATVGCDEFEEKFNAALSDDLNTPKALDALQRLLKSNNPSGSKLRTIFAMDRVLGLGFESEWRRRRTLPGGAANILKKRETARAAKDWKQADSLRQELADMGVTVKDTSEGQTAALSE